MGYGTDQWLATQDKEQFIHDFTWPATHFIVLLKETPVIFIENNQVFTGRATHAANHDHVYVEYICNNVLFTTTRSIDSIAPSDIEKDGHIITDALNTISPQINNIAQVSRMIAESYKHLTPDDI